MRRKKQVIFSGLILLMVFALAGKATARIKRMNAKDKQEVRALLSEMSAKQAEARVIQERLKKIDEGADDIFNNLPEAKKLGAEFAKIINSPVGKRIGEKIQKWEELNRQGELEGLMDEEERQAFKRYEYITGEFRKMYDAEIEKVKQELAHLNGKLSVLAEELKKKQDTFGKEAIDKLRN